MLSYTFRGIVTFVSDEWGAEYMHLFTATEYTGKMIECDEGELVWVPKSEIGNLKLCEGDKIFLKLLNEENKFFSLKLRYKGENLVETKLNTY